MSCSRDHFIHRGFTLIEVLMVVGLIAILVAIVLPKYEDYRYRIQVAQAVNDIVAMSAVISQYQMNENALPTNLAAVGLDRQLDPWGTPYRYTDLTLNGSKGKARKDRKLNPLNSDFDLYSIGKDKESTTPLTPKVSHDDVLRANDGAFIGLGKDF